MDRIPRDSLSGFVRTARDLLREYGRDYALGAVRGLATRNMTSIELPPQAPDFYPLVKIHHMALLDLEELFYSNLKVGDAEERSRLLGALVAGKVWE